MELKSELVVTPDGSIFFDTSEQAAEVLELSSFKKLEGYFNENPYVGLLHLGLEDFADSLPFSFSYWRSYARSFVAGVCKAGSQNIQIPAPSLLDREALVAQAFCLRGFEYVNTELLEALWMGLNKTLAKILTRESCSVQEYLTRHNLHWNLVGRVCFHLAENKKDEVRPFAFLATYTTQLSHSATAQHLPLKRALQEYAGEKNQAALLSLLTPLQKLAAESPFIKALVDSGQIFQPLPWTAQEAYLFLQTVPLMEESGIVVKTPNWWSSAKPPRPKVVVKMGESSKSTLGLDALLDFKVNLALSNGEQISRTELEHLLQSGHNLMQIKGQWVEVDHKKLTSVLAQWDALQESSKEGLSLAESLRLLASGGSKFLSKDAEFDESLTQWSTVVAGDWLKNILDQLKNPQQGIESSAILDKHLRASLRPYQKVGTQWLLLLYQLQLGGCLADDMGLGKTMQIISLLILIKENSVERKSHLLIVPASLIGNWQKEIERFAPHLKFFVAHSSITGVDLVQLNLDFLKQFDLVITTYALVSRFPLLGQVSWDLMILDEAQQIKNPSTKQTLAVKAIKARVRFALTGTPVENRLGDLWSLFDFTSPGLLGSASAFSSFIKKAGKDSAGPTYRHFIGTLKELTQPYILRRLKSDKKIISDLPDKTELQTYCYLSREQVKVYEIAVRELTTQLETAEGIQRRGLVLSYLLKFKQICNHPSQWLGYGDYNEVDSGKFIRLKEICEEIAAKQEKVLIFTQFREIIPALSRFLAGVFGREGLVLDGSTPIKKRAELVSLFQQEGGPPFFILSLKAGGTGLTLTKASHVIHFDRWWNPAVENQATDRAYRIGQKHPVLVHKFICRGTIEEKIDAMIATKKELAKDLLEGGDELLITELSDDQLLNMVKLDLKEALGEF